MDYLPGERLFSKVAFNFNKCVTYPGHSLEESTLTYSKCEEDYAKHPEQLWLSASSGRIQTEQQIKIHSGVSSSLLMNIQTSPTKVPLLHVDTLSSSTFWFHEMVQFPGALYYSLRGPYPQAQ